MGLVSGTFSFTRYRVTGREPQPFWEEVDQRLRKFAFRELEGSGQELSLGWVGLDNFVDAEFSYASYSVGDYLVFSLRIDRRVLPPSLLKKHILKEESRLKKKEGRKRISREERREIKERARQFLLNKILPVPSIHQVCWCISGKWLLLGSSSPRVKKEFERLFTRCFGLELVPYLPWDHSFLPADTAEKLMGLKPSF